MRFEGRPGLDPIVVWILCAARSHSKGLSKRTDIKITLVVCGEYPVGGKTGSKDPREEMMPLPSYR